MQSYVDISYSPNKFQEYSPDQIELIFNYAINNLAGKSIVRNIPLFKV